MSEYLQIEYRIGKDGKITETVINGSGKNCTLDTKKIEKQLGVIDSQELLPEYYEDEETLNITDQQSLKH